MPKKRPGGGTSAAQAFSADTKQVDQGEKSPGCRGVGINNTVAHGVSACLACRGRCHVADCDQVRVREIHAGGFGRMPLAHRPHLTICADKGSDGLCGVYRASAQGYIRAGPAPWDLVGVGQRHLREWTNTSLLLRTTTYSLNNGRHRRMPYARWRLSCLRVARSSN